MSETAEKTPPKEQEAGALCTIFPILVPFLTFLRWDLQIHIFWLQITWILLNWRFLNSGDLIGDLAVANPPIWRFGGRQFANLALFVNI